MCLLRDLSKILGNSEGRVIITGRYRQSSHCTTNITYTYSEFWNWWMYARWPV